MSAQRLPLTTSSWSATRPLHDPPSGVIEFQRLQQDHPGQLVVEAGRPETLRTVDMSEELIVADFAELADGTDDEIAGFGDAYGPLRLCEEHGLPVSHIPASSLSHLDENTQNLHHWEVISSQLYVGERIDDWRRVARQASAILSLSAACRTNWEDVGPEDPPRRVDPHLERLAADWVVVGELPYPHHKGSESAALNHLRYAPTASLKRRAALGVQTWLEWGDVRARFEWIDHEEPRFVWAADSLFGTLAYQLALTVSRSTRFAICVSCHAPFATNRKPQTGRDTYCGSAECKLEKERRYQRRRRAKLRVERLKSR